MSASARSSGTETAPLFSPNIGPTSRDGEMLLPTPHANEAGWTPDGEQDPAHRPYQDGQHRSWGVTQVVAWISSAGDTPASPSASPEDEMGSMITEIYGLSSPELFATLDPDGSCWRTLQTTLDSDSGEPLEIFPRWGMTRAGELFVLRRSEHPISAPDSSPWLHTPTATDSDGKPRYEHRASPGYVRNKPVPNLMAQVTELLPTPDTTHGRKTTRTSSLLPGAVEDLLPTPKTPTGGSEKRAGRKARNSGGEDLEARLASLGDHTNPPSHGGNE